MSTDELKANPTIPHFLESDGGDEAILPDAPFEREDPAPGIVVRSIHVGHEFRIEAVVRERSSGASERGMNQHRSVKSVPAEFSLIRVQRILRPCGSHATAVGVTTLKNSSRHDVAILTHAAKDLRLQHARDFGRLSLREGGTGSPLKQGSHLRQARLLTAPKPGRKGGGDSPKNPKTHPES